MITVNLFLLGFGPGGLTRDVRITVQSDADGIASLELRDRTGVPLSVGPGVVEPGCARAMSFEVRGIPTGQFPLFVWTAECSQGQPTGEPHPFGPLGPGDTSDSGQGPAGPATCPPPSMGAPPSPACVAARDEVARLRNEVIRACGRLQRLRLELTQLTALAILLYALAALLTVLAVLCFVQAAALAASGYGAGFAPIATAIGYGFVVAAGVATAGAIAATVAAALKQREVAQAKRDLDAAVARFQGAAEVVRRTCCPGDFLEGDVTLPRCP